MSEAHLSKKSLKIPKMYSEAVNRRRTDNAMTKNKKNKPLSIEH